MKKETGRKGSEYLQRGDIKKLVDNTQLSRVTISRFVNGHSTGNTRLQKAFEELVEIRKKQSEEVGNRIREAAID